MTEEERITITDKIAGVVYLIHSGKHILEEINEKFPDYNKRAIKHLGIALELLEARTDAEKASLRIHLAVPGWSG